MFFGFRVHLENVMLRTFCIFNDDKTLEIEKIFGVSKENSCMQ